MKIFKTKNTGTLIMCLLLVSSAFCQSYEDFDRNRDGGIDQEEFNRQNSDTYDQYDTNRDGSVDEREFYDRSYNRLDQDDDNILTEEEWNEGRENMFGDFVGNMRYVSIDQNLDRGLSTDEFYNGMSRTEYYEPYDTDRNGTINRNEMSLSHYRDMDRNSDNQIDQNDFDNYGRYYMAGL